MINKEKKLTIKPYEPEDVPILEKWFYSGDYPDMFRDTLDLTREQLKIFSWMKDGQTFIIWSCYGTVNQEAIGYVMLHDFRPVASNLKLGILIDKKWQQKGGCNDVLIPVMDYVYYRMNYRKIILEVVESNKKLNALMERRGFKKEAVLESEANVNGKIENVIRWTMFKEDYEEKVKKLRGLILCQK